MFYKEEMKAKKPDDRADWDRVVHQPTRLKSARHCQLVKGKVVPQSVTVQDAVTIGIRQIQGFEASWPSGFQAAIPMKIVTRSVS